MKIKDFQTLKSGILKEDGTASAWSGTAINGRLYGRWKLIGATDGTLACYKLLPGTSDQ